jgi:hypothetical protein
MMYRLDGTNLYRIDGTAVHGMGTGRRLRRG